MKMIFTFLIMTVFMHSAHAKLPEPSGKFELGARLQGMASFEDEDQDMYLRRTRVNINYYPWEDHELEFDVRNDKADKRDRGKGEFSIGDASWKIKLGHPVLKNIKLFRSKVDVSYSQTSSSRNLFYPNRTEVSDKASDFIIHGRRATNIQTNGSMGQLAFQIAVADGVNSDALEDINANEVDEVTEQKLSYGAKLRYYFVGDAQKNKVQNTFYGQKEVVTLGAGYFRNDRINITHGNNTAEELTFGRSLQNYEFAMASNNTRAIVEYFVFENDIIDLTQENKTDILGKSEGSSAQFEFYFFRHFSVYNIFQTLRLDTDHDDGPKALSTTAYGFNYYPQLDESLRYGVVWKKSDYDEDLPQDDDEKVHFYVMMHI